MLTSFNPHFLANIERAYTPLNFSVELGHSVSPIKYEETFFLKTFIVDGGQFFFFWGGGGFIVGCSTCGINDQIMQRAKEFHERIFR